MWGVVAQFTSCGKGFSCSHRFAGSMDAAGCPVEFAHHIGERRFQRRALSNQDVIVAGTKERRRRRANELAQTAPYSIAFNSVAHLLAHGKADPRRTSLRADAGLQDKSVCMRSCATPGGLSSSPKVTTAFQPLHLASPTYRHRFLE